MSAPGLKRSRRNAPELGRCPSRPPPALLRLGSGGEWAREAGAGGRSPFSSGFAAVRPAPPPTSRRCHRRLLGASTASLLLLPTLLPHPAVKTQGSAVREATFEGAKGAGVALLASSTVVLGACKLFPKFNRSLSVSGKTALIVRGRLAGLEGWQGWRGGTQPGLLPLAFGGDGPAALAGAAAAQQPRACTWRPDARLPPPLPATLIHSLIHPPLQVTPMFGTFFLLAELKMNESKRQRRHL